MFDIFLAGVWHESNTFSPLPADLQRFRDYQWLEGEVMLAALAGTNTEIGGMHGAARECDFCLHPGLYAAAIPSGPVTRQAFETIAQRIVDALRALPNCDGVLLALHGAMVVEGLPDGDGELLRRVRAVAGERPIVASFDLHANLSDQAFALADVLIGYDTLPHIDMGMRGREAALILHRILVCGRRPDKAMRRLPLITVPQMQATADEPMRSIMHEAHFREQALDLWCCSVVPGFAYADVAHLGVSVLAYGDGAAAERCAEEMARAIWRRRDAFLPELMDVDAAVQLALRSYDGTGPIVIAEPADNVGGGSPGDITFVLEAMLKARASEAIIMLWDPTGVAGAKAVGKGNRFSGAVGGFASKLSGKPVSIDGVVTFLDQVTYARSGPYMTGQRVPMGDVAIVDCGGLKLVLTGERVMPFDADHWTVLGLRPEREKILCVKGAKAWRAGFGAMAAKEIFVDTPGPTPSNVKRLPYRNVKRPVFPLDAGAQLG
jgi:microcystin degradation protein MlrC